MTPHSMNAGVKLGGNSLGLAGTNKVLTGLSTLVHFPLVYQSRTLAYP